MDDLKWFLGIMAVLFIAWWVTGGPARYSSTRPFIKPLPPVDTGEVYGPPNLFGVRSPIYSIHPNTWKAQNLQYFVLYTPAGWNVREFSDGTTYSGEITNGQTVLTFEFGQDTNPLDVADDGSYAITTEDIGTYTTKIIMPASGTAGTTGAYYKKYFKKNTLTITGENLSKSERETALTIFRSVRFKI